MSNRNEREDAIERAALAHFHATRAYMVGVGYGRKDGDAERVGRSLVWQWADQDDSRDRVTELIASQTPREGSNRLSVGDEAAIDMLRDAGLLPWPDDVPLPDLSALTKRTP